MYDDDDDYTHNILNTIEEAGYEAAAADGVGGTGLKEGKNKRIGLRRGKWTTEEENYANRLIQEFKSGLLPLTDGTTLRTFLSKLLNCDPMRISKKFVGGNCIGKQVFRRRQQELERLSVDQIERSRRELADLERRFLERVAQTNRTSKDGEGIKMNGYPEDGMSIGLGVRQLAPWMMPPDEFQAPMSAQPNGLQLHHGTGTMAQQPQHQQQQMAHLMKEGHPQVEHQTQMHHAIAQSLNEGTSKMHYEQSHLQQQLQQQLAQMQQLQQQQLQQQHVRQQHSQQGRISNMSAAQYVCHPQHSGYSQDAEGLNSYRNVNGTSTNFMHPSSSNALPRTNSLEFLNSLDDIRFPSSQSLENFQMYSNNGWSSNSLGFDWTSTPNTHTSHGSAPQEYVHYLSADANGSIINSVYLSGQDSSHQSDRNISSTSSVGSSAQQQIPYDSNGHPTAGWRERAIVETTPGSQTKAVSLSQTDSVVRKTQVNMPRNSSVENFWLLVDMGDLPQPETNVLSETLFATENGKTLKDANKKAVMTYQGAAVTATAITKGVKSPDVQQQILMPPPNARMGNNRENINLPLETSFASVDKTQLASSASVMTGTPTTFSCAEFLGATMEEDALAIVGSDGNRAMEAKYSTHVKLEENHLQSDNKLKRSLEVQTTQTTNQLTRLADEDVNNTKNRRIGDAATG